MATFTQWQGRDYPAGDAPFRAAEVSGPQPHFRNDLDALRTMYRRTPDAQYPDGYLGTIESKRRDRLYDGLKSRTNVKPFSRGVHKGERMDNRDYFWPPEFEPWSALESQSAGMRYVIPGALMDAGFMPTSMQPEPNSARMAKVGTRGIPARVGTVEWGKIDPDRATALKRLAPPWSGGPSMGMALPYPGR
jgi:hypothetical protein